MTSSAGAPKLERRCGDAPLKEIELTVMTPRPRAERSGAPPPPSAREAGGDRLVDGPAPEAGWSRLVGLRASRTSGIDPRPAREVVRRYGVASGRYEPFSFDHAKHQSLLTARAILALEPLDPDEAVRLFSDLVARASRLPEPDSQHGVSIKAAAMSVLLNNDHVPRAAPVQRRAAMISLFTAAAPVLQLVTTKAVGPFQGGVQQDRLRSAIASLEHPALEARLLAELT